MEAVEKRFHKRDAILAFLRQSKEHPTAEALYSALHAEYSGISLATVYRNLALFKQQGLAISLGTVNGKERFDGRTDPHIHFCCSSCGNVDDLENYSLPAETCLTPEGYRVDAVQVMLTGVCPNCLKKQN